MKEEPQKERKLKPSRIIQLSPQETKKMEAEEKEKRFWKWLMYDNLGGKKGHDN